MVVTSDAPLASICSMLFSGDGTLVCATLHPYITLVLYAFGVELSKEEDMI